MNVLTIERAETARTLVEQERFSALIALLIDAEVVNGEQVAAMCTKLADRLDAHARSSMGRMTSVPELLEAARRSRDVARMCREVRCG